MLCISNCYRKDGFVEGWLVWLFIQSFMGSRPWFAFRASKTRSDRLSSLLDALNRTKSRVCGFVYFDGWQVNARKYVHTDFLFDIGYTSGPFLLYCRNIPLPIFILDIAVNWILVLLSIRNSYLSFWHRSIKRYLCSSEKVDRKGYGTPLFDNKSVDEAHKTKNHSTEAYPKQSLLVHRTKQLSPWANPRSKSKKSSSSRSKLFTGVGLDRIWSCSVAATDFFCPTVSKRRKFVHATII